MSLWATYLAHKILILCLINYDFWVGYLTHKISILCLINLLHWELQRLKIHNPQLYNFTSYPKSHLSLEGFCKFLNLGLGPLNLDCSLLINTFCLVSPKENTMTEYVILPETHYPKVNLNMKLWTHFSTQHFYPCVEREEF